LVQKSTGQLPDDEAPIEVESLIMKRVFGLAALVSFLALSSGTALACAPGQTAYHANGEDYCYSTSDGGGQAYKPSSFDVTTRGQGARAPHTKAEMASLLAQFHRQRFH
jgi:hypothetical protein